MTSPLVSPPRVAIIGVSGYGRIHFQLAREGQERGELRIVAAAIINPEVEPESLAWLKENGCVIYSDYEKMLADCSGSIELCLIPTGIHWHARMTVAALRAGANVLVEKPLASSLAEVAAIQELEEKTQRFVAVGFQDIYEPGTLWLERELKAGRIGTIQSIRFLGSWPRARSYYTRNDWAGRLRVGEADVKDSPLNNAFAHFVMLSLFFLGDEHSARTLSLRSVELLRAHDIESFDTGVVLAETGRGVKLWFGASHACHETIEPEIVITGSEGKAIWRYEDVAAWTRHDGQSEQRKLLDITGARRAMFQATLERLRSRDAFVCTTSTAALHTNLIQSIHNQASVIEVPRDQVSWKGPGSSEAQIPEIAGLATALRTAYNGLLPLSEAGLGAVRCAS